MRSIRTTTLVAIAITFAAGCGGGAMRSSKSSMNTALSAGPAAPSAAGAAGAQAAPATVAGPATPQLEEKLVIEGELRLKVEDVREAAGAIRARIEQAGGRVITENLSGSATSWSGSLRLRVPPGEVDGFTDWIESIGDVVYKQIQGTDVSRQLFDQEIALENLTRTLERLRKLLEHEGLAMKDILDIEREMTRLRGEIERIKGEQRYLKDRVALATITIQLTRKQGPVPVLGGPKAKFFPGARASSLILLDRDGRERTRLGAGFTLHFMRPKLARSNLEVDIFEDADGTNNAVIATLGGAAYSDFLGRGRRRFFNPYLGLRIGYGYLDGSRFAFGAGAGVELFKNRYVMVDASVRFMGLAGDEFDAAVVPSASAVFAW